MTSFQYGQIWEFGLFVSGYHTQPDGPIIITHVALEHGCVGVWVNKIDHENGSIEDWKTRCGLKTANTVSKHRTLANYGEMQARITRFTSHRRFNIGISVTIIRIGLLTFNGIHTVRRFRINLNKFTANLTFSFVPEMMLSS